MHQVPDGLFCGLKVTKSGCGEAQSSNVPWHHLGLALLVVIAFLLGSELSYARDKGARSLLIVGDSLSYPFLVDQKDHWTHILASRHLADMDVYNASFPGRTADETESSLAKIVGRLRPDYAMIILGGNDAIQSIRPRRVEEALSGIAQHLTGLGTVIGLMRISLPDEISSNYRREFDEIFDRLSAHHGVCVVPFFLDELPKNSIMFYEDGLHPRKAAQGHIALAFLNSFRVIRHGSCSTDSQR